jgi:23S rRNA pseudouridine955/2504/2580 synthase
VNFQEAGTRWRSVSMVKEASLLEVRIETGRTHQIRRHLQAVGHPVAGDRRYGDFPFNRAVRKRWGLKRMFLHAWRLELPHPVTKARLNLEAKLPKELTDALSLANLGGPDGARPGGEAGGRAGQRRDALEP